MNVPQTVANEIKVYWAVMAELRAAEAAGDVQEQCYLHAELGAIALHSDNPILRATAARACNAELAAAV
jgi:hypothetical protein